MVRLAPRSHWTADLLIIGFTYEVIAVATGLVPTYTQIAKKYPAFGPALVGGLVFHLYAEDKVVHYLKARSEK